MVRDCLRRLTGCLSRTSFDSRARALRADKSKRLRDQTASSLKECEDSFCNISSSLEESGGTAIGDSGSYEEELKRSKPYIRACVKEYFSAGNVESVSSPPQSLPPGSRCRASDPDQPPSAASNNPHPSLDGGHPTVLALRQDAAGESSSYPGPPLPAFLTTQSSSSRRSDTWAERVWTISDDTQHFPSLPTNMTAESSISLGRESPNRPRYVPVRVEIEGLGSRTAELDRDTEDDGGM